MYLFRLTQTSLLHFYYEWRLVVDIAPDHTFNSVLFWNRLELDFYIVSVHL